MTLFLVIIGLTLTLAFVIALFAWLPRIVRNAIRAPRRRK